MTVRFDAIDYGSDVPAARLWSLPAALEHLKPFAADQAGHAGKSAALALTCPAVLVPQPVIDALIPTLVQLVRNAVAHGVEAPMVRLTSGKPLSATIVLAVAIEGRRMTVAVEDDGAGIDAATAARLGRDLASTPPDGTAAIAADTRRALLLRHGIALSGRGDQRSFGLRRAAARIGGAGGRITFATAPGRGTRFVIALPVAAGAVPATEGVAPALARLVLADGAGEP